MTPEVSCDNPSSPAEWRSFFCLLPADWRVSAQWVYRRGAKETHYFWGKVRELIERRTVFTFSGRPQLLFLTLITQMECLFSHERRPQFVLGTE